MIVLLLAGACTKESTTSAPSSCSPAVPDIASPRADQGAITLRADIRGLPTVGLALRDTSVTILAFCVKGFPRSLPDLRVDERIIPSIGGTFERTPEGAVNYVLFPPTYKDRIDVVDDRTLLAKIAFPTLAIEKCLLHATRPFHVVACGSLIVVDWKSRLAFDPSLVTLLDVQVREPSIRLGVLGFYFLGVRKGSNGLIVRFGFQRPRKSLIEVRARAVYQMRNGTEAKVLLHPPVEVRFTLLGEQN